MSKPVELTEVEASMVLSADWPGTPWTLAIGDVRANDLYRLAFTARKVHWSHENFEDAKDCIAKCIRVVERRRG